MKNLNEVVQNSLYIAQTIAQENNHGSVSPTHFLLGLIENPSSKARMIYASSKEKVKSELNKIPKTSKLSLSQIQLDNKMQEWLTKAVSQAVREGKDASEETMMLFANEFIPIIKHLTIDENAKNDADIPNFLTNLNILASEGRLDPVIGRKQEIRSMIEILGRRSKNNPILVGPAGVGKTAVVEGLAEAIFKGDVPPVLKNKTIYSLDLGALTAGTKFRGDFEEKIQNLLSFAKEKRGEIIIFIDEIHQIIGAGKTDGAMDAANLLKPALARGDLFCIGATTSDEYQKYIQSDPALERRFRPVIVDEPSTEDTIEILLGLKDRFEVHHGIKISEEAIEKAVIYSKQYITDKKLPDKALDLIDEAASSLKLSAESMPIHLVNLEKELRSKKIQSHFKKDDESKKEVELLEEKFKEEKKGWEETTKNLKRIQQLKDDLNKKKFQVEQAELNQDYELASKLKYSEIPQLEKQIKEMDQDWVLSGKNIAQIVSQQKQIPIEKILQSKQENILKLEDFLQGKIFGQKNSITTICNNLIPTFAGLNFGKKVLGSFLLAGPSGTGKTQTAKSISEYLFDSEDALIRFDLSEYSEKHSVAKLIGSPVGYVGYESGGILTEAVKRKPHSVILFDEIEKAHSDFQDILLQVLDAGRLTDNKGRIVDFSNTIIFITTNATDLSIFKKEFLGRLDAVCQYMPLGKESINLIINEFIKELMSSDIFRNKNINFVLTESARDFIIESSSSSIYGARLIKNLMRQEIVVPLSKKILNGSIDEINNKTIKIDFNDYGITITQEAA